MTRKKPVNIASIALTPTHTSAAHILGYFNLVLKLAFHHSFSGLMLIASPVSNITFIKAYWSQTG